MSVGGEGGTWSARGVQRRRASDWRTSWSNFSCPVQDGVGLQSAHGKCGKWSGRGASERQANECRRGVHAASREGSSWGEWAIVRWSNFSRPGISTRKMWKVVRQTSFISLRSFLYLRMGGRASWGRVVDDLAAVVARSSHDIVCSLTGKGLVASIHDTTMSISLDVFVRTARSSELNSPIFLHSSPACNSANLYCSTSILMISGIQ